MKLNNNFYAKSFKKINLISLVLFYFFTFLNYFNQKHFNFRYRIKKIIQNALLIQMHLIKTLKNTEFIPTFHLNNLL